MIRELPFALLLLAGVVSASSVVCNLNHRCVYHQLCVDGFINTDGTGQIDPRIKPVPDTVPYPRCEEVGTVCCRHPDNPDGPDVVEDICPFNHRCVSTKLCINGEINTSGIGLIDVRVNANPVCTDPEYTGGPAVCCKSSLPADSCPVTHSCVPSSQCNGGIIKDTKGIYIDCYLDATKTDVGVCCDPLGVRDTCSSDGSLQCVENGQCYGQISKHDNGNNVECHLDAGLTGVCCKPPLETCPVKSACVQQNLCRGDILDESGNFVSYQQGGSWQQCLLNQADQSVGVCCSELPPSDGCGVRHYGIDTRIQNTDLLAYQAEFAEFPWQAIIFFTNFTFKCGASLIGDHWLLTGAHCVHGFQPSDFKVRLGEWQVDKYDEPGQYHDVDVAAITIHPQFNDGNLHNDIAVIKLATPVVFKYHINTICLPEAGKTHTAGERCFSTGWGKDAFDGGSFQVILKKVDLPFVPHGACQEHLRKTRLGYEFILDKSFLCAGGEVGKDACTGDGGGPLACLDPNTGKYVLSGITAWGVGCGEKDVPGVYADVSYFRDWVYGITGF